MWFDNWQGIVVTLIRCMVAYSALVVMLRISGKRTLSKMNAFDLVVTVAFGSILVTTILSREVAIAEGLTALAALISMQWLVAQFSVRSKLVRQIVKSEPTLLAYSGVLLDDALLSERIAPEEVRAAVRDSGILSMKSVQAVILETDGSMSVIPRSDEQKHSALEDVQQQISRTGLSDHA